MAEQRKNTLVAGWDESPRYTRPYPVEESRRDLLRRLGGSGMHGGHVWGD